LADDYRSVESKFTDQDNKIVHDCGEVVAIVGFARLTMSALIDPHDWMTSRSQFRRDAVPHARIRGQTMNQYERCSRLIKTAG
jgi:hypothetical protein